MLVVGCFFCAGVGAKSALKAFSRKKLVTFELMSAWDLSGMLSYLDTYVTRPGLLPAPDSPFTFDAAPVNVKQFPVIAQCKVLEGHVIVEPPATEGSPC